VLAATFVSMPFLIVTVESGLRLLDRRYEDAAATLGADRWTVLRRVVLPLLWPSLAAGMALSWARALGEFGATITFAGNLPGRTQTMPLAVYLELERNPDAAYLLSFVLLAVSVVVLVALRDRFLRACSAAAPWGSSRGRRRSRRIERERRGSPRRPVWPTGCGRDPHPR
jgi:molybdate transport system permease protein